MRLAMIIVGTGLVLAGALAGAEAQPPGVTMDQAVARFGTPVFDRNCEDGSITLAWKEVGQERLERLPANAPRLSPYHALAAAQARCGRKAGVVMKFDAEGRLLWSREIR